jgi:hypothetical protein
MRCICIDDAFVATSFSLFDNDQFLKTIVSNTYKAPPHNKTLICYDAKGIVDNFEYFFCYDVKLLYELAYYKFESLEDLYEQVFKQKPHTYLINKTKLDAYVKSYDIAKIDVRDRRWKFESLVPKHFANVYFREKSAVVYELFKAFKKESILSHYKSIFYDAWWKLHQLGKNALDVDLKHLDGVQQNVANVVKDGKVKIQYKATGTKHGRLVCEKGTFNILTLPKNVRTCVTAGGDYVFAQFDFKSFQPRLAVQCSNNESLKQRLAELGDVYSLFSGDRSKNKLNFLKWMFSGTYENERFENEAWPILELRNRIFDQAKTTNVVVNDFGRTLVYTGEERNVIFQHYIASLEADAVLTTFCRLFDFLNGKKSHVSFLLHDALILKIHTSEMHLIKEIKTFIENLFVDSFLRAKFPVDVKTGNNFGEMTKWAA